MSGLVEEKTIAKVYEELAFWYAQPLGKLVTRDLAKRLSPLISGLFGYHLLQIGNVCGDLVRGKSAIRHCVSVAPVMPADLVAFPESLPLATDSVDVVILPHTLEIDPRPHQVLREVERVLIPDGHIVIVGFNPWSLFGLWRLQPALRRRIPWSGHFFSLARIRDWLTLLDFEITHTEFLFHRPPIKNELLMRRMRILERIGQRFFPNRGGIYIVVARKRLVVLTPLRRSIAPKRRVLAPGYAHNGG